MKIIPEDFWPRPDDEMGAGEMALLFAVCLLVSGLMFMGLGLLWGL